jgi:hypothetical protein
MNDKPHIQIDLLDPGQEIEELIFDPGPRTHIFSVSSINDGVLPVLIKFYATVELVVYVSSPSGSRRSISLLAW